MKDFFQNIRRTNDWQAVVLGGTIFLVALWILLLPQGYQVSNTALNRFHLNAPSFAAWAIQQPVPSMYNFENRYWVSPRPLSARELDLSIEDAKGLDFKTKMANHFPARIFTFGDSRKYYLEKQNARYLYLQSRYRGNELNTVFEVTPAAQGFDLQRKEVVDE